MTKSLLTIVLLFSSVTAVTGAEFCIGTSWCFSEGDGLEARHSNVRTFEVTGLTVHAMDEDDDSIASLGGRAGCVRWLSLHGVIGPDSTYIFKRLTSEACDDAFVIFLQSSGGTLKDGLSLGEALSDLPGKVWIPQDAVCASACAIAFLHSASRNVNRDSILSFHAPYTMNDGQPDCSSGNRTLRSLFVRQLGEESGKFAYNRMFDYCGPDQLWSLNAETMVLLGFVDEID